MEDSWLGIVMALLPLLAGALTIADRLPTPKFVADLIAKRTDSDTQPAHTQRLKHLQEDLKRAVSKTTSTALVPSYAKSDPQEAHHQILLQEIKERLVNDAIIDYVKRTLREPTAESPEAAMAEIKSLGQLIDEYGDRSNAP